ncbi:MAG: glycerol-3-phosphate 1-O-acyltransferase PlsY [Phycisphaerae bacterium]
MPKALLIAWLPLAYLIGGIPFGYLIGRLKGVDIRTRGSGNIGATNVGRALGAPWGMLAFALDAGKCAAVILAARWTADRMGYPYPGATASWLLMGVGLLAIVGNVAPVYLKFRGGKAVAGSLGVILSIWPDLAAPGLIVAAIWLTVLAATRYVAIASLVATVSHPVLTAVMMRPLGRSFAEVYPLLLLSSLLATVIVVRHRSNMARLLAGTEQKIGSNSTD